MTKVAKIDDKRPKCCYCGLVPADDHPEYTCPRLAAMSITDDGIAVDFVDPLEWQEVAKKLGLIE